MRLLDFWKQMALFSEKAWRYRKGCLRLGENWKNRLLQLCSSIHGTLCIKLWWVDPYWNELFQTKQILSQQSFIWSHVSHCICKNQYTSVFQYQPSSFQVICRGNRIPFALWFQLLTRYIITLASKVTVNVIFTYCLHEKNICGRNALFCPCFVVAYPWWYTKVRKSKSVSQMLYCQLRIAKFLCTLSSLSLISIDSNFVNGKWDLRTGNTKAFIKSALLLSSGRIQYYEVYLRNNVSQIQLGKKFIRVCKKKEKQKTFHQHQRFDQ